MFSKLILVPVLFGLACLMAGCYGALHNQISYSVCPEYFTKFKFVQFDIGENVSERVGAAVVGWRASWWMGIAIGAVLIPIGLVVKGAAAYFRTMIAVFVVVAVTTLAVGATAGIFAFLTLDLESVGQFTRYGNEIENDLAFARAGTMHNFGYAGGLVGIVAGGLKIYFQVRRFKHSKNVGDTDNY